MVAARSRDKPLRKIAGATQQFNIDQSATGFERASWRVVFVLDDYINAGAAGEKRPGISRGRRNRGPDYCGRSFEFIKREERHGFSYRSGVLTANCD